MDAIVRDFLQQQRHHIMMEDRDFFPVALKALQPRNWTEIAGAPSHQKHPLFSAATESRFDALRAHILQLEQEAEADRRISLLYRACYAASSLFSRRMPYSLAIFDLDGTLVDSFPWFKRAINDVADKFGFLRVADEDVEKLRHASTREILTHLQVPLWKLPAIARYARRLKAEATAEITLFAGVESMLETLATSGVQLALVTSDSEANARQKLGRAATLFSHFGCAASLFGKPTKFRRVIRRSGATPGKVIAIGDEVRDIEAARAVGIACGAVCWGYAAPAALRAHGPDYTFERISEIADILCRMPKA